MSSTIPSASRFVVKGINDDRDFCMCCGRTGLQRVVWIEDRETGDIRHFGTTCAQSPVKGFPALDIKAAIKAHDKAREEAARVAMFAAWQADSERMRAEREALYAARGGTYVERVFKLTGKVVTVPADAALHAACHAEAFKPARR